MKPAGILETVLYAEDLDGAEAFYREVLGMEPFTKARGRHLFYRCGNQVLLIFNPQATSVPPGSGALPVPPHGALGPGHLCFRATAPEIDAATLRGYEGEYPLVPGFGLSVKAQGDTLTIQGTGQPALPVQAVEPDVFVMDAVGAEIRFERDAAGNVVALTLKQAGQQLRGERK